MSSRHMYIDYPKISTSGNLLRTVSTPAAVIFVHPFIFNDRKLVKLPLASATRPVSVIWSLLAISNDDNVVKLPLASAANPASVA